jgi:hypothetical protein
MNEGGELKSFPPSSSFKTTIQSLSDSYNIFSKGC